MTSQAYAVVPEWTMGDRLRKARELAGLGQREFADVIGVSTATVTNAEKGHVKVRKITVMAWAMATGVSLEWLETGTAPVEDDGGRSVRQQGLEPRTRCITTTHAEVAA